MEFDSNTLRPTFRLRIGLPGASNAFAIAERLGLDKGVLRRADAHLSELHRSLERTLLEAERQRTELDTALEEARISAADAAEATAGAQREADRLRDDAQRALRRARSEADELLLQARRALRQAEEASERATKRNLVEEARAALAEAESARAASTPPTASTVTVADRDRFALLIEAWPSPGPCWPWTTAAWPKWRRARCVFAYRRRSSGPRPLRRGADPLQPARIRGFLHRAFLFISTSAALAPTRRWVPRTISERCRGRRGWTPPDRPRERHGRAADRDTRGAHRPSVGPDPRAGWAFGRRRRGHDRHALAAER